MKTVWKYSTETEAKRLIHCARQMAVGFYRVNNFIVLPYNPRVKNAKIVTFPDLAYNKIPRFWEKTKKVDIVNFPIDVDKKNLDAIVKLLKQKGLEVPGFQNTKKLWSKAEKDILGKIYEIIPSKKGAIKKLTIHPTLFGTGTSFNWINKKGEIYLYLRGDEGIGSITEAVLTSLTRQDTYKNLGAMWQESELLVDWLVTESVIAKVIKKYDKTPFTPTLKGVRVKQQAKLLEQSDKFYKKLGLPTGEKVFNMNGKVPEIRKKPIANLSANEKLILNLLIEKAGGVVTFDELGDNMFANEDSFSLYAISKSVERLRNKLETNGVSGSYIQTLRGKGYLLKN